jgi:carbamoyl-phosphate synthase large subunit
VHGVIRLLFLGASSAVGLFERFLAAASSLHVDLQMYCFDESQPWHAGGVAGLVHMIVAPKPEEATYCEFLTEFVRQHAIDVVLPGTDQATVALSKINDVLRRSGTLPLCASETVCLTMNDKRQSDLLFRSLGLRVPSGQRFPLLAKPRFGAGSRGIITIQNADELLLWRRENQTVDYLLQPYIYGVEYSVDAYVDGGGILLGAVSRIRLSVSGGEVTSTCTHWNASVIEMADKLLRWGDWHGPLTVQVIFDGRFAYMLECNPRFGSGVTCSIEAGLVFPEWVLRERLGLPLPDAPVKWRDRMCMTRSWKDHFIELPRT